MMMLMMLLVMDMMMTTMMMDIMMMPIRTVTIAREKNCMSGPHPREVSDADADANADTDVRGNCDMLIMSMMLTS